MKKSNFVLYALTLLVFLSCQRAPTGSKTDLSVPWRFHSGDDPAWIAASFDDSKWEQINPTDIWEHQGYKNLDGFAWYRIRVAIPHSLTDDAVIKDSLQIRLGKIDDYDQVFLNGELIGENGINIAVKTEPRPDFFKGHSCWELDRRYVLAVNDPRIHWDQENVIAVRAYDQGCLLYTSDAADE